MVCPETGPEEARLIAERVRRAVAETSFSLTGQGGETAHVTVSVGFATFPQDAPVAIRPDQAGRRRPVRRQAGGPRTPCAASRTSSR